MNRWKLIDHSNQEWDAWVGTCRNADVYHHAGYIAAMNTEPNAQPKLLVFQCDQGIVIHPLLFRALDVIGSQFAGYSDATSCYGYGGPAWNGVSGEDSTLLERFWNEEGDFLRSQAVVTEFVRVHPLIPACEVLVGQSSLLDRSHTVAIDLTRNLDELWAGLSTNHRRNIRKARKASTTVQFYNQPDSFLQRAFVSLYRATMDRVKARSEYYFSETSLAKLFDDLPPRMAWLALVRLGDTIIAAFLNLSSESVSHYHLGATSDLARDLGVSHLLMFESAIFAKEKGCQTMHLGGGNRDGDELLRFKAGFGGSMYRFQTVERILLPEVFMKICEHVGIDDPDLFSYFPAYRAPSEAMDQ